MMNLDAPRSALAAVPSRDAIVASFRGAPHMHLEVGAHRLAYRRFGRGPDLLFVHGWPLNASTFRDLAALLAPSFTCHLVDLPGSSQSKSPDGAPLDFASHAEAVRGAADALGLARFGLVAHDSGGLVARLAAAADRRIVAIVSGNTEIPGHTPGIVTALLAAVGVPGGGEMVRLAMRARDVRRSAMGFGGCFADLDRIDGEFHDLCVAPLLASRDAWAKQVAILRTIDDGLHGQMRAAHARLTAPVLFVWGEDDPIFPIEKARAMLPDLAGGASLSAVPGARCFVHEERPREFAAYITPFLEQHLGGRRP